MAGHGQPPPQPEQTVRVYNGADRRYSLTARAPTNPGDDFQVCLAPTIRGDEFQHWIKYMRRIKDEEGRRAFALVNKATGKAIHGQGHRVLLVPYNRDNLSVLWTDPPPRASADKSFRRIRMVNNINLNLHVDQHRMIVLRERRKGSNNQYWQIVPRPGGA